MSNKQLVLFKNVDVKRLDSILTELEHMIYAMKHFALHQEISLGRNKSFMWTLENAKVIAEVAESLCDLSFKYQDRGKEYWEKITVYQPYYPALEPRSPFILTDIARDYKSRCNAILLRLQGCLRPAGIAMPRKSNEIIKNLEKITDYLRHESTVA